MRKSKDGTDAASKSSAKKRARKGKLKAETDVSMEITPEEQWIPCGLRNLGATCYANSLLQCL